MAKTYSFRDLPKPINCSAVAVAGGSLAPNTTYYYRVIGTWGSHYAYWYGKSEYSEEFSVTTTATDLSVELSFDSPIGENPNYKVFRSLVSNDQFVKYRLLKGSFADSTHNVAGRVTLTDDGSLIQYSIVLNKDDNCHGRLTISGSSSSDMFSIVDLYNDDQLNGRGVIQKFQQTTYKINTRLIVGSGEYWKDTRKTLIFTGGMEGSSSATWYFGSVDGNRTYNGCNIICTTEWLSSYIFGNLYAYRTTFVQYSEFYSNYAGGGFYSGVVQDCQVDKWRNFYPYGKDACTFKNCIFSYFDNLFSAYRCNIDGMKCLTGSRVWQIGGSSTNVVARGVYTEGCKAVLVVGGKTGSSLTVIDSIVGNSPMFGNYSTNNGFEFFDKFSYNLKVVNDEGIGIENIDVKMFDKDNVLIMDVLTDSNGDIVEQYVTRNYGVADQRNGEPTYTYDSRIPHKLVVSKDGYGTYREIITQLESTPIVKTITMPRAGFETKIYNSEIHNSIIY